MSSFPSNSPGTGTPGANDQLPSTPQAHHLDSSAFALSDLLTQMEDYSPTLPDSVANSFLHSAGFEASDPRLSRLLSLVAQKFISDIVNDAYTHCKLRTPTPAGKGAKGKQEKKMTLTLEDLVPVLAEYGITVKKPPYYL